MKKLFLLVLSALLLAAIPCQAEPIIRVTKVFSGQAVTAAGSATSPQVDLYQDASNGIFSLQVAVTGDGTCKFEYLMSSNGTDFIEPTTATDIASSITKTSGPGGDGKDIYSFSPEPARYIKIKVTETGGAETVTISAWLATQ